jgi:hypothetical protein
MANIKIEDLMQSIRDSAGAKGSGDSRDAISRAQANLAIADRARDQLPPLTTYRRGLSSRIELWLKRLIKRLTHWFTWEQVNFNAAVNHSLNDTLSALQKLERQLSTMKAELDETAKLVDFQSRLAALESRFALIEDQITASPPGEAVQNRIEQQKTFDLILTEQRVCFKQLSLEISETGKVVARTERNLQTRLDELARRIEEVSIQPPKARAAGSSDAPELHDQQKSLV